MYQLYKSLSESVQPISDSPVEVLTLCPCPPETSNVCVPNKTTLPVLSLRESKDVIGSALEVDGGIFNISNLEKLAFSYGSNAYPVNGTAVPSNLE